ncbi:MAG: GGDEF domain-containing protein [Spirochaetaceae bacterium]|jgi:diguanylate cyclase (GGDEF)-like protein|nr:GGDEF domain-containing protein [Spirochaetaceae bacterium]
MEEKEYRALEHIKKLLKDNVIPPLEGDLAELPLLQDIHTDLKAIREITFSFSMGDLSPTIKIRGIIPGCLKTLQAHLRHLVWQVQMVEQGDFLQQVQFLGEFSTAFNSMVRQFDATLKALKQKEEALTVLADSLRSEVDSSNSTVEALRESESQFKYLASHDPLTGALNRRSFMDRAIMELAASINHNSPCSIVMMDIDHFKIFNDTYGHLAGDEVLRHIVGVISALLRKNDFLGRYGGEEFIFYFSRVDRNTSIAIAERVREAIAGTPVKLKSGPVPITASFGIATLQDSENPEEKNDLETCIHHADIALYQAKKGGRNKVVCFSKDMAEI